MATGTWSAPMVVSGRVVLPDVCVCVLLCEELAQCYSQAHKVVICL